MGDRVTGRTTAELAELLRISESAALALMQDSAALGLVEQAEGRWRLTQHAEIEFGAALRELHNEIEDASEFASDRRHEAA